MHFWLGLSRFQGLRECRATGNCPETHGMSSAGIPETPVALLAVAADVAASVVAVAS